MVRDLSRRNITFRDLSTGIVYLCSPEGKEWCNSTLLLAVLGTAGTQILEVYANGVQVSSAQIGVVIEQYVC